ncbi:MAG: glutamate--tRNA ligase, partial [Methylotenera sp.]|nr:glutamate--tRNA ligase [Methylotenera sp.]
HYIKVADLEVLAKDITQRLERMGILIVVQPSIKEAIALYRDRANTLNELAQSIAYFYSKPHMDEVAKEKHITADILPVLNALATQLASIDWTVEAIHASIEHAVTSNALKFPKVAMPLRVMLTGGAQSPGIDAVMAILGKDEVLARIRMALK